MTQENQEKSDLVGILDRNLYHYSKLSNSNFKLQKNTLDKVVHEEPLQIKINDKILSITMRTPGHDKLLAIGFLFSEGIIKNFLDISNIHFYADSNIVNVIIDENKVSLPDLNSHSKRGTITSSSCGVCGRESIDDILSICSSQEIYPTIKKEFIQKSVSILSQNQTIFSHTGGCHGAAAINNNGDLLFIHEDIGRHNAVDKVIGSLVENNLIDKSKKILSNKTSILVVSGRLSFEIVQKCAVASIPVISSVSAPSSLAIDLAAELGITITSFVRKKGFNIYTHKERII